MISVLVYGRNDTHGYNLHKRAAISLNSLSELLDDDEDEIIFVDYNTPDELPTFLEAICDTLSDKARRLIRILRVRPGYHQRRCGRQTHLAVVEPIARNIGLRRSNPANRWVLSTNTDMVFLPNERGTSLSDICRSLADGFYHLPRFELPEALWGAFNRLDGGDVIERVRAAARRFHLDEVVGARLILYDAPGDFQLALRRDLFAIFGFDEAMVLGWHVDSNHAIRMKLQQGEVASAKHHLRGYHCSHHRQLTVYHDWDAQQNDWQKFVAGTSRAEALDQVEDWGAPDEFFEEMRLDGGDSFCRYAHAVSEAIPQAQTAEYLFPHPEDPFDIRTYRVEHVLPYLLDVLSTLPPRSVLLYCGASPELLERLAGALPRIVPAPRILVPADAACSDIAAAAAPIVAVRAMSRCLEEADLLIFEFAAGPARPGPGPHWAEADRDRLAWAHAAFLNAADHERARLDRVGGPARRFVVVNAIGNIFEGITGQQLHFSRSPLSTRIRHGVVRAGAAAGAAREAGERNALPPGGGLFAIGDWEDPAWVRFVRRHAGGFEAADDRMTRSPAIWERATILRLLDMHGMLESDCRILCCAREAGPLPGFLAQHAIVVMAELGDAASLSSPPRDWLDRCGLYDGRRMIPWHDGEAGPFDAVVISRPEPFFAGLRELLGRLRPLLQPRARVVASGLVETGETPTADGRLLRDLHTAGDRVWREPAPGFRAVMPIRLDVPPGGAPGADAIARTSESNGHSALIKGVFVFGHVETPR